MNQPFPALERLELRVRDEDCRVSNFQPPFLSAQTPHLRHLKFTGQTSLLLSRMLSRATSVTDLTLNLDKVFFDPHGAPLLSHLQDMPFLHRLELEINNYGVALGEKKDVLLSKLTSFCFAGTVTQLDALTAGLAAPSLMELRIARLPYSSSSLSPPGTTRLSRVIRTVGKRFFSARLDSSREGINLSMRTDSNTDNDPPFRIVASSMPSIDLMSYLFSAPLATIQDVFLASPFQPQLGAHSSWVSWRAFFALFHNAKILRLARGIESEIEAIIRLGDWEPTSQLLPALEEIELNATTPPGTPSQIDEKELASVLGLFKGFVDARQQAGRPVSVRWNADRVVPSYFCEGELTAL